MKPCILSPFRVKSTLKLSTRELIGFILLFVKVFEPLSLCNLFLNRSDCSLLSGKILLQACDINSFLPDLDLASDHVSEFDLTTKGLLVLSLGIN
jgi:hypothetical protein